MNIYKAAWFFVMPRYRTFGQTYLETKFGDEWTSIKRFPSRFTVEALLIGTKYNIKFILRHCYYDLARTHPLALPIDGIISPRIFSRIMNVQRHISLIWDNIREDLDFTCSTASCDAAHSGKLTYRQIRKDYPLDPIYPLASILDDDLDLLDLSGYCCRATLKVKKRLRSKLNKIWEGLNRWAGIEY